MITLGGDAEVGVYVDGKGWVWLVGIGGIGVRMCV